MNNRRYTEKTSGSAGGYQLVFIFSVIIFLYSFVSNVQSSNAAPEETITAEIVTINSVPIICQLSAGEKKSFSIDLEENEVVWFQLDKRDLRLTFQVFAPDGDKIFSGIYLRYGVISPWFIGSQEGRYRVEISSLEELSDSSSSLELKVDKKYPVQNKDHSLFKAEKLFQEAESQRAAWTTEALRASLKLYEEAARWWMEEKQWRRAGDAIAQMGEIYLIFGDYQKSIPSFSQAQSLGQRSGDLRFELESLSRIAEIYILIGDEKNAAPILSRIENGIPKIASQKDRKHLSAIFHNRKAEILAPKELGKAREEFQKALDGWREIPDRRGKATSLLNLGCLNFDAGEILEAEQNLNQSLSIWQSLGDRRGQALVVTVQAHLYAFLNQSDKALNLHLQAKAIFTEIGDRQSEAVALNGAGNVYEFIGLPVDATNSYYRALKINEELGNQLHLASTEFALARAFRSQKKMDEALIYYEKSRQRSIRIKQARLLSYILSDLAGIDEADNMDAALNKYLESIPYYDEIQDIRGKSLVLTRIGKIYIRKNKFDLAERKIRQALKLNNLTKDGVGISDCWYYLAEIKQLQEDLPDALDFIEKSITLADEPHSKFLNSTLKIAHQSTLQEKIQLQIEVLMQMSREQPEEKTSLTTEAFEKVEASRARTLRELLENLRIRPEFDVESEAFKEVRSLEKKIAAKIETQIALAITSPSDPQLKEIEYELDDLRAKHEKLQTNINTESLKSASLINPLPTKLTDIQVGLEPNTAYLSYFLGKKNSYLWMVTTTDIKVVKLSGQEMLEMSARDFYQILISRQKGDQETQAEHQRRYAQSINRFCQKGKDLSELLLKPIASDISDKRLLVSLDGALQYIPFDALPDPRIIPQTDTECRFVSGALEYRPLLITNEVVYTPSFAVLKTLREVYQTNNKLLPAATLGIWVDPVYEAGDERLKEKNIFSEHSKQTAGSEQIETFDLPAQRLVDTKIEADYIESLMLSGRAKVFTGFDVNRQNIARNLGEYRFLHLAVHGFFNNRRPQHSGLLLSKFDEQGQHVDSVFSLQDIFRLRLQSELLVLSACQTGLGEEFSGEGLTGLKHAFLASGAKSVVVSLWKVKNGATAELMQAFYRSLIEKNLPASTALRQAKLEIFKQKGMEEPFFWAGLTLHGDYHVTIPKGFAAAADSTSPYKMNPLILVGITILIVIGSTFWRHFRKRGNYGIKENMP